jgi:hypothetical protein
LQVSGSVRELFEDACAELSRDKLLLQSKYEASPKLQLHQVNGDLMWLAAELALERTTSVLSMSRQVCPVDNDEVLGCMLHLLRPEAHTFEQFCALVRARQLTKKGPVRSLSSLLDEMPSCLCRLLWPQATGLQLVNQFYGKPLSISDSRVFIGGPSDSQLPWGLIVESATCLASFQLKTVFGCNGCKLGVLEREVFIIANRQHGCLWRIKAVDDAHIKIYSEKGELGSMAGV